MDRCISYQSRPFEYLFPSPIIFTTFCLSYDRTELFIISMVRLFIWIVLYFLISELIDYEEYPVVQYGFYIMFGINIMYIGLVVAKDPVFSLGANDTVAAHNEREGLLTGSIPHSLN
jgi:hypothetical protein